MTYSNKLEFEKWYSIVSKNEFNFKKEFEEYCRSDVRLLTEGNSNKINYKFQ
jgi:hypothetical protein